MTSINELMTSLVEQLDIPNELRKSAVQKYNELGAWLKQDSQQRYNADSALYFQGSIKLGTIVTPINPKDDYDIDLVYRRDLKKESVTQDELKKQVGLQLENYIQHLRSIGSDEIPRLEEGRRCWTLVYPERFHMDILPALPDAEKVSSIFPDEGILITDIELRNWQLSNPKGYAAWFQSKNKIALNERMEKLAKSSNMSVEQLDENDVKTTLQQSIQILKRFRDITYNGDPIDKPISIIISTLAAAAYNNDDDLLNSIIHIVQNMDSFIEEKDGKTWVTNPANKEENFADKWEIRPSLKQAFFDWTNSAKNFFSQIESQSGDQLNETLSKSLGNELVKVAQQKVANKTSRAAAFAAGAANSTTRTKPWTK